jgi:hypothetical protein
MLCCYAVFQRVQELDRIDAEHSEQEAILQATLAKHRALLEEVLGETSPSLSSQSPSSALSHERRFEASNSACSLNANSDSEGGIVAFVTPSQATELNEEEAFERMLLFSGSRSGRLPTNLAALEFNHWTPEQRSEHASNVLTCSKQLAKKFEFACRDSKADKGSVSADTLPFASMSACSSCCFSAHSCENTDNASALRQQIQISPSEAETPVHVGKDQREALYFDVSDKSNRKQGSSPHDTETACSSLSWHELETSEAHCDSAPASPHLSIRTAMATRKDPAPAASSHGSSVAATSAVKRRNGKEITLHAVEPATQSERLLEGNETGRRATESQGGVGVRNDARSEEQQGSGKSEELPVLHSKKPRWQDTGHVLSDDSASAGSPLSERTSSPFTANTFTAKTPHSVTFEASLSIGADGAPHGDASIRKLEAEQAEEATRGVEKDADQRDKSVCESGKEWASPGTHAGAREVGSEGHHHFDDGWLVELTPIKSHIDSTPAKTKAAESRSATPPTSHLAPWHVCEGVLKSSQQLADVVCMLQVLNLLA